MNLLEKKAQRIFFVLYSNDTGLPLADILPSTVSVTIVKKTDTIAQPKTVDDTNFFSLGDGLYALDLLPADTSVLGHMAIVIKSNAPTAVFEAKYLTYDVVPEPIYAQGNIGICTVYGNVKDLGGEPGKPLRVIAIILKLPTIVNANVINAIPKETYTDIDGLFKLKLAIGTTVRLEVADAGLRRQFVVPNQTTANIIDLPQPL